MQVIFTSVLSSNELMQKNDERK